MPSKLYRSKTYTTILEEWLETQMERQGDTYTSCCGISPVCGSEAGISAPQGFPGQQYSPGLASTGPYPGHPMQYHSPGPQRSAPSPSYPSHRMPLQQVNVSQLPAVSASLGQFYKVGHLPLRVILERAPPCGKAKRRGARLRTDGTCLSTRGSSSMDRL